jgi:hypothetical protein
VLGNESSRRRYDTHIRVHGHQQPEQHQQQQQQQQHAAPQQHQHAHAEMDPEHARFHQEAHSSSHFSWEVSTIIPLNVLSYDTTY